MAPAELRQDREGMARTDIWCARDNIVCGPIATGERRTAVRIGFCTGFREERIKFAAEAGFDTVEVFCGAGAPIDPAWKKADIERAKDLFAKYGIWPMTIFHYEDYADPDPAKARQAQKNAARTMDICRELGVKVMTINAWVDSSADLAGKIKCYKKIYGELAKVAGDKGIKLGIENCPHGLHNIAWSPEMWEIIFHEVPSRAIGLEYDPSHLVWMGVDYIDALYKFGDRVYAFHAKDTEVMETKLAYQGIYGRSWWRYRIPGWGDIDWNKIFTALYEIGYKGDISIEHEDPVFEGKRNDEGLKRGLEFLRQFVNPT
jgi:sugar phosphate isomerase/epimerase